MVDKKAEGIPNDTQFPKERKEVVEYRPGAPGQDCVSCQFFEEPESCAKVTGLIYRSGVCNLWEPETGKEDSDPDLVGIDQEGLDNFLFGGGE